MTHGAARFAMTGWRKRLAVCGGLLLLPACRPKPAVSLKASGTIEMTEVYLSAPVPGRVETLSVREGDTVKRGQLLGTLDHYAKAQKDFDRARRLIESGGSSEQQSETAQLALRDQALIALMDGIVMERISEPGEVVTPGVPVVILGNPKDMWVKVYFPESDIGRVRVGQAANVQIDSAANRVFSGHVTFISPKAEFTPKNVQTREERVTQMFAVKVSLDPSDGLLKPGMPADVDLRTDGG